MPLVSATDWLNFQCADRLISAVLIGPSLAQVATSTGQPTPQNNTPAPSFRHTRHYNVHTDTHSMPNTYFQHTIHTIYAQLSNYGIASHTQYTLYNVHAQQSNLGNTRLPVTVIKHMVIYAVVCELIPVCRCEIVDINNYVAVNMLM